MKTLKHPSFGLSSKMEPGKQTNVRLFALCSWPNPDIPPLAGQWTSDHLLVLSCTPNFHLCGKNCIAYSS